MRTYKEIIGYLNEVIIPKYKQNDEAHGIMHIKYVAKRALKFAKKLKCDLSMIRVAAYFHDIGHSIDPLNHEQISAEIFWQDEILTKWFNEKERLIIKEAIEDHRASTAKQPRSIYGEIISSADRSVNVNMAIQRSVKYNFNHYWNGSRDEIIKRVNQYIVNKYSDTGYAKVFVSDSQFFKYIKRMRFLICHPKLLDKKILFYIKREEKQLPQERKL